MATRTVEVNGIEFEMEFDYTPFRKGYSENGQQLEPDELEEVELLAIKTSENFVDLLNNETIDQIEHAILKDLGEYNA